MYNPCEHCNSKYPKFKCKGCDYYKLQMWYMSAKRDLNNYAQCQTCAHTDCANRELYGALGQKCLDWKYKEEPNYKQQPMYVNIRPKEKNYE